MWLWPLTAYRLVCEPDQSQQAVGLKLGFRIRIRIRSVFAEFLKSIGKNKLFRSANWTISGKRLAKCWIRIRKKRIRIRNPGWENLKRTMSSFCTPLAKTSCSGRRTEQSQGKGLPKVQVHAASIISDRLWSAEQSVLGQLKRAYISILVGQATRYCLRLILAKRSKFGVCLVCFKTFYNV